MSLVYFIQSGANGPIKIGTALNVTKRMAMLQTGNPEQLMLLSTVSGGRDLESALHFHLASERVRGEWFKPSGAVFAAMVALPEDILPLTFNTCGDVIRLLGGPTTVARDLRVPTSTVHSWCIKNSIPNWRHASLVKLAAAKGRGLTVQDLLLLSDKASVALDRLAA